MLEKALGTIEPKSINMKIENKNLFNERNYDKKGKEIVSNQTSEKINKNSYKAVKHKNSIRMK